MNPPNVRSVLSAICVAVLVAAAALVWHHLPTPTDLYGPFDVHGSAGEPVRGRAVTATVTSVRVAPTVNSVPAAGRWVVIDATLQGRGGTDVPHADLLVGPNTYIPTDRFLVRTLGRSLAPGIEQRGSWVFDVAPALVDGPDTEDLVLRVWVGSDLLDSRLAIAIPAEAIGRSSEVELDPVESSA
ncbi:hypothetical protein FK535_11995 [Mycolicibacterium sp. 018/SC-01/001]|uniref:hypothetical protein n=1 Tax=Mycolicibacterium sp. 018/SC-01/001 TaxID=2592069 RepID=UPI00117E1D33|nr:hypothetical protein [Mycolicibacterium sp. 018/SC-01/001]TRW83365.1 hypothetical protein FK535_11995 [Mycolicibacterium sp. 018/SC-01/001]